MLSYLEEEKTESYYHFALRGIMTRAEILSEIKQAEEEAKSQVAQANEMKNRKISEANMQARENIKKAEEEAQKYSESAISEARKSIREEREKIVKKGIAEALEVKDKSKKNVLKATKFILTEFERAADA